MMIASRSKWYRELGQDEIFGRLPLILSIERLLLDGRLSIPPLLLAPPLPP
jgi:hypothetical protein